MARYNPFFEKAGMRRVDYKHDMFSIEKEVRSFLEDQDFESLNLSFVNLYK
jgi:hypothetical protein